MTPEERETLTKVAEGAVQQARLIANMSDQLGRLMFSNAVLTAACGSLYAELAKVAGRPEQLDEMLARTTAIMETRADKHGYVLEAADALRAAAEAQAGDLGLR